MISEDNKFVAGKKWPLISKFMFSLSLEFFFAIWKFFRDSGKFLTIWKTSRKSVKFVLSPNSMNDSGDFLNF